MMMLLLGFGMIGLVYWLIMAYSGLRLSSIPILRSPGSERSVWPCLSVIIPACNEAVEIEDAARTLLNQDYPNLQLIYVDDRSTDTTGQVIDTLANSDSRIKAIHIGELPEKWLGKVHALHTGLQQVIGDIVLFTDADVHYADGALKAAVDHFINGKLNHLAGFPGLKPSGLFLGAMLTAFLRQFVAVTRPWKVSDPRSGAFIGIGAFNMVDKQKFLAAGGFEWLRMEVADDVGVGLLMKRSGHRCDVVWMTEWLGLYWHRTIRSAVRGTEKGWSSICHFSVTATIILGFINTILELSPLYALFLLCPSLRPVGWLGVCIMGVYVFTSVVIPRRMRQPILHNLMSMLVAPFGYVVMIRTAILGYFRGGVVWRGTLYPTQDLKSGMRLNFRGNH
jgi:glycosyltransferase involved in cell wall biosynthesis